MHELGIASGILDIVRQHVAEPDGGRVRAVKVRVGDMAGVVCDSLAFCFSAMVADTPFSAAYLDIERVATRCRCAACDHEFTVDEPAFLCPACQHPHVSLVAGDELQVIEVELDDTLEHTS